MLQENIYDKEQLQIVKEDWKIRDQIKEERSKLSEEERKKLRLSYNRFLGDTSCRIVKEFLHKHVPEKYDIIVSGYIWPLPREYDLLIVRREAKPRKYTKAYNIDDVFFIIEVKARGMFPEKDGKEKGLKRAVDKLAKNLKEPITKFKKPHVKLACLLIGEAVPKREAALKWTKKVREFMKEHNIPVFILSNTRAKTPEEAVKPFKGEWGKFVKYVIGNLPKT